MSYSFPFRAANKNAACLEARERMKQVAEQQVCHKADMEQAIENAERVIMLLPEAEGKELQVSMNGYLSGDWQGAELVKMTGCSISCTASWVDPVPK